jgi:hypothetical protein
MGVRVLICVETTQSGELLEIVLGELASYSGSYFIVDFNGKFDVPAGDKSFFDMEHELLHGGRVLVRLEGQTLLMEMDIDALVAQVMQKVLQVSEVSSQSIYAVNVDGIAGAYILQHCLELRPVGAAAASLVVEGFVERYTVELPFGVLLDCRDADVSDICHVIVSSGLETGRQLNLAAAGHRSLRGANTPCVSCQSVASGVLDVTPDDGVSLVGPSDGDRAAVRGC